MKKGKSFDFKKTKTLNNFNKNQIQLRYFVIFLAIIKLVRLMCVGDLHVILNIEHRPDMTLFFHQIDLLLNTILGLNILDLSNRVLNKTQNFQSLNYELMAVIFILFDLDIISF